ncbi:cysteinyl leukotriene receptor 2 [Megalops cyprinoides]|uniref:cysteinyl leukotriene receptor 2 n=1 Tax=Megalops cyprinoides TaxID=118141 RepID=UPI0018651C6F|nr:cysteinyl leukotriene receptor 2 [Megalops cyprinoides]
MVTNRTCLGNVTCNIDNFKHIVYPATYLIIFALGLVGNLFSLCVFLSVWRRKGTLTSVNLYLVNLLLSDLTLVCSLPFRAAYFLMGSNWVFGDFTCRLISYIFYINMYGSVYFLTALSIMRYLAVTCPFKYVRLQSSRGAKVVCLLIWLFVSLVSTPLLTSGTNPHGKDRVQCLELGDDDLDVLVYMNHATIFLSFILPVFIISFCYFFVVRSLLKPREVRGTKRPSYRRSCALVIIVLAIFLVCYLPYHVVRTLFLQAEQEFRRRSGSEVSCDYIERVRKAAVITLCLVTSNSCLDPILFFFVGENFREFFHRKHKKIVRESKRRTENRQARTELQGLKPKECECPEEIRRG